MNAGTVTPLLDCLQMRYVVRNTIPWGGGGHTLRLWKKPRSKEATRKTLLPDPESHRNVLPNDEPSTANRRNPELWKTGPPDRGIHTELWKTWNPYDKLL